MSYSIICVGINTEGNLGAIARLCYNFNITKLILIQPKCRIKTKTVYERAIGGKQYIDEIVILKDWDTIYEFVEYTVAFTGVSSESLDRSPIPLKHLSEQLPEFDSHIGLVFGREDVGLSNDELKLCNLAATIPLWGNEKSSRILNISHAVSIVLYELSRNIIFDKNNPIINSKIIDNKQKLQIFRYLEEILQDDYFTDDRANDARKIFSTVLGKSFLNQRESTKFVSFMRRISIIIKREVQPQTSQPTKSSIVDD